MVQDQVAGVQASVLVQVCDEPFVLGEHSEVRSEAHWDEILAARKSQEVQEGRVGDLGRVGSCRKDQVVEVRVREVDHFHGLEDQKVYDHRSRGHGGRMVFFRRGRVVEDLKDAAHLVPYRGDGCHFGDEDVVDGACLEASGIVDLPKFQGASLARGHKD
jgi:hypothetical protein